MDVSTPILIGKFDILYCSSKHLKRISLTRSENTGTYVNPQMFSEGIAVKFHTDICDIGELDNGIYGKLPSDEYQTADESIIYQQVIVLEDVDIEGPSDVETFPDIDVNNPEILSQRDLIDIATRISGGCNKIREVAKAVGGFMLAVVKLIESNKFTDISDDPETTSDIILPRLIFCYKDSFNDLARSMPGIQLKVPAPHKRSNYFKAHRIKSN